MAPLQRDESGDLGRAPRPREGRDREDCGFRGQDGSQRHREPAAGVHAALARCGEALRPHVPAEGGGGRGEAALRARGPGPERRGRGERPQAERSCVR